MQNKKINMKTGLTVLLVLAVIFLLMIVSITPTIISVGETNVCCEKTTSGAWCQNAPQSECAEGFLSAPTSCDATSYCKLGTCSDSVEGTCMENTPERVCENSEGVWYDGKSDEIPQCSLGCCLMGDQAAYVTQTRCKRLSSVYGLEINFRSDIRNEVQCIASATSDVKGACVFEEEFDKTCLFITKRECQEMGATGVGGNITTSISGTEFHEGFLCSADGLGTICGPTKETTCVEGKDQVYFVDSCGNIANVYDADKINDKEYWSKIYDVSESCGFDDQDGNANSRNCGNCDYFLGSTCKEYNRGQDNNPVYGDYVCRDLSCKYEGETHQHGETWCANAPGIEDASPGSRHFRLICYNGDVSVEPCADYRQEVCIESDIGGFKTAACRVNRWQDCLDQKNKQDCENTDRRDCVWNPGTEDNERTIKCVPKDAPGLDFWNAEGDSATICAQANTQCIVEYEKRLIGDKKCVKNCECLGEGWAEEQNQMCNAIADCGNDVNYVGVQGFIHTDTVTTQEVKEEKEGGLL